MRSRYRRDIEHGVRLLQGIYDHEPERRRECTYYLALGYYRLGDFAKSRELNAQMLNVEPRNAQFLSLQQLINDRVQEGTIIYLYM